jgi:hypothetical protein
MNCLLKGKQCILSQWHAASTHLRNSADFYLEGKVIRSKGEVEEQTKNGKVWGK